MRGGGERGPVLRFDETRTPWLTGVPASGVNPGRSRRERRGRCGGHRLNQVVYPYQAHPRCVTDSRRLDARACPLSGRRPIPSRRSTPTAARIGRC